MSRPPIDLARFLANRARGPIKGTLGGDACERLARALRKIALEAGPKSAIVTRVLAEEGIVVGDEP